MFMTRFFFFNDTATTEIYTLSLHDALPISDEKNELWSIDPAGKATVVVRDYRGKLLNGPNDVWVRPDQGLYFTDPFYKRADRKSTRLNSSHANISYAVFCLKKKNDLLIHYI